MKTNLRSLEGVKIKVLSDVLFKPTNPIILIDKVLGTVTYRTVTSDKKDILGSYKEGQTIMFIWQGKYKSDVFEIKKSDIARLMTDESINL